MHPARPEAAGSVTYTATFTNSLFTAQTKTVTGTALGHSYGTPTYTWSEDNKTVTARVVCTNDSIHIVTETVNTTANANEEGDSVNYTASFTNALFTAQTKNVVKLNEAAISDTISEAANEGSSEITIDVSDSSKEAGVTEIGITDTIADKLAEAITDSEVEQITIRTDEDTCVGFDQEAMENIAEKAKETGNVTLTVEVYDNQDDDSWASDKKGTAIDVSLVDANGDKVLPENTSKTNGMIIINIPYSGNSLVRVYYRSPNGSYVEITILEMTSTYVSIATTHLSSFVLVEMDYGITATCSGGMLYYEVQLQSGQSAQVILASYDELTGQMIGCEILAADAGNKGYTVKDGLYYKLFLVNEFVPLYEAAIVG